MSIIFKKSPSSLAAAALETADMTRRKERGVTGIPWDEEEHSSFDAKIASIRSRSDAEHRDCKLKVESTNFIVRGGKVKGRVEILIMSRRIMNKEDKVVRWEK